MRSAAARLLGTGNGSKALSFGGGNGASQAVAGSRRIGGGGGLGTSTGLGGSQGVTNYDGKGTYIVFNAADTLFISDLNSQEKDPLKSIHFSNSNPLCHAFDPKAKEGHDLIIGMGSGDVYSMSLRQQLQDHGRKPVAALHYNRGDKDVSPNGRWGARRCWGGGVGLDLAKFAASFSVFCRQLALRRGAVLLLRQGAHAGVELGGILDGGVDGDGGGFGGPDDGGYQFSSTGLFEHC